MLLAMAMSGCISSGDDSSNEDVNEDPVDEDFQGLDYVECMIHEDLERCWNVLVPSTVNLSQQVPMIIDLHGNTLTMENQRALSEFDEIAEENGVIAVWPQGFDNSWNSGLLLQFGRRTTTERYWTDSGDSQQGRDESLLWMRVGFT